MAVVTSMMTFVTARLVVVVVTVGVGVVVLLTIAVAVVRTALMVAVVAAVMDTIVHPPMGALQMTSNVAFDSVMREHMMAGVVATMAVVAVMAAMTIVIFATGIVVAAMLAMMSISPVMIAVTVGAVAMGQRKQKAEIDRNMTAASVGWNSRHRKSAYGKREND